MYLLLDGLPKGKAKHISDYTTISTSELFLFSHYFVFPIKILEIKKIAIMFIAKQVV